MPKYRVTAPDGATYEVMAPDGATEQDAINYIQSQMAAQKPAEPPPEPAPPLAGNQGQINYTDPGYREAIKGLPPAPYRSWVLPLSTDEKGKTRFDPNEGILGVFKRAGETTSEGIKGKFDPMSREAIPRMMETAFVMTPLPAASRVTGGMLARKSAFKTAVPPAPTREALAEATTAGYRRAGEMGIQYDAQAVKRFADTLGTELEQKGYISELAPEAHALLNKLRNPPQGAVSVRMQDLDSVRKVFGKLGGNPDPTKASVASQAVRAIDDFMATADPTNVVPRAAPGGQGLSVPGYNFAGSDARATAAAAKEAARTLAEARGNAAAGFRSDKITGLEDTMGLRAAAANSGRNIDNAARQRLVSLLQNKKDIRGFSKEEQLAIRDIINGTPTKNAARYIGNLFGGGGGLGQFLTTAGMGTIGVATGGSVGGVVGASVPTAMGALGKMIANRLSKAELKHLDELVRSRSPLAEQTMIPRTIYAPRYVSETAAKGVLGVPLGPKR